MDETKYVPRNYQEKLIAIAVKQNSIIYLPTGSGKTFIAVCVIKELANDAYEKPYSQGGKITVMLVNTVALVQQHTSYLQLTTPYKVGAYTGDMNVDFWDKAKWLLEYDGHQILVMTAQIFANTLAANITSLERVNLLVFDECHQAVEAHSMRQIMMKFKDCTDHPRVLGLTATLLNGNKKLSQVLNEVKCLETTYHAQVATVDELENVLGYSTNPVEKIAFYNLTKNSKVLTEAVEKLNSLCEISRKVKLPNSAKALKKTLNLPYLEEKKDFDKLRKLMLDAIVHIEMLGISGGLIAVICYIINLECEKKLCTDNTSLNLINAFITKLVEIKETFEKEMSDIIPQHRLLAFASPKLLKVVEILNKYSSESTEDLCGIIFVQRKNTAIFVYHFIKKLVEIFDNLKHIKPEFIVGFNANPFTMSRESLYYTKMNKKVMEKFKSKESNLLIASNVIEEGIDVPRCSLVVKFDTPTNYREYIQSKGRARHQTSLYHIMVEAGNNKFGANYQKFKTMERDLNKYLIGRNDFREGPDNEKIEEMYKEVPSYYVNGPDSAHLTMLSSIQLLMMYCSSLQADCYTNYEPTWYLEKRENKVRVLVELPIVAPIIAPVPSSWFEIKKDAKRSAAMNACILLHKCGALNDQLAPEKKIPEFQDLLFTHWPEVQEKDAGITKKRRVYNKMIPKSISTPAHPKSKQYLHIINLMPVSTPDVINTDAYTLTELYRSDQTFGFLTTNLLPILCGFPIYVSTGALNVTVDVNEAVVELKHEEIESICSFHHLVFADIVNIKHPFLYLGNAPSKNMLLVPVSKSGKCIDFSILQTHREVKKVCELTLDEKLSLEVDDDNYYRKIVTPWYRQEDKQYLVLRVCDEMIPRTPFPNNDYNSYEHYFRDKYDLNIFNQKQSLLWVKTLSSRLNCIKPRGISKKRKLEEGFDDIELHLIPELCVKDDFPSSLWVQAKLLPTLLHRIIQLLRCEEFRSTIAAEANLGLTSVDIWKPLELDEFLITYEIDKENEDRKKETRAHSPQEMEAAEIFNAMCLNKEYISKMNDARYPWLPEAEPKDILRTLDVTLFDIEYYTKFINASISEEASDSKFNFGERLAIKYDRAFVHKKINLLIAKQSKKGPELKDVYQAFTTAKSNDIVNLERLETLGDSFLKLIASLYIFLKHPKYNEGQATSLKGKLVSNKNLFYLGINKKISEILQTTDFAPRTEWLPPGYRVPRIVEDLINNKKLSMSNLYYIDLSRKEQISGQLNNITIGKINEEVKKYSDEDDDNDDNSDSSLCCFFDKHTVPEKTIADSVEALIGVYFECYGVEGGLRFMEWLGIIPKSENIISLIKGPIPNPIINQNADIVMLEFLMPSLTTRKLEKIIGYKFKNKAFLLQALTHSSYSRNRLTYSYERLEFIGDAVLDFLITTFIYESCGRLNPGQLTDLRSSLVNNEIFAAYVVKLDLHKYLLHYNSQLLHNINKFVYRQQAKNFAINDDVLILLNEDDLRIAENVDVPKVLGDIFESIAGAIYLDSGMDMNKVWEVYYKIMWEQIDAFSKDIPRNPIRLLLERLAPLKPTFSDPIECNNGNLMIKLDFMLNGSLTRVHGFGDNKKTAKKAASKIALMLLKSRTNI